MRRDGERSLARLRRSRSLWRQEGRRRHGRPRLMRFATTAGLATMSTFRYTESSAQENHTISFLSFNVWGLKFVSKDRRPRIKAIAQHLASSSYDIVCLQELWIHDEFELVRDQVLQVLPFSRFFHTGALGSGLAIFTRYPIVAAQAFPYALSGLPLHVLAGDFFVNKAAGYVVVLHPVLGEIEVWNTHMHAAGDGGPDTNQAHRMAQAWQLANALRAAAARGRYVLAAGDYNSQPESLPVAILRSHGRLHDSFLAAHPAAQLHPSTPLSPAEAIQQLGMTCDSPLNSYSAGKPIGDDVRRVGGKRLDYIFFRGPEVAKRRPVQWGFTGAADEAELHEGAPIPSSMDHAPLLTCSKSEVVLTGRVPGQDYSYSDHFGLLSTFTIIPPRTHPSSNETFTPLIPTSPDASKPSIASYTPASSVLPLPNLPTKIDSLRSVLNVLRSYRALSRNLARSHLRLFVLSLVAAVALIVGSAWQPKSWLQPIFTLVGTVIGAAGATLLYVGFVWGRWEEGLLTEVMSEIELELDVVEMEQRGAA